MFISLVGNAITIDIGVVVIGLEIELVIIGGVDQHPWLYPIFYNIDWHGIEIFNSVVGACQGGI
jgi:hypothetical protein